MGVKCQFKKFNEGKVHFMRSSVNVKYFGGGGGEEGKVLHFKH
jgi:hypothetical protein